MEEQPTCGRSLAEHSVLPAKVAELIAALGGNLEVHMKALDPRDASSRKEFHAYQMPATEYGEIAAHLEATARQMAGYRDLPMGTHDAEVMSSPQVRQAFERFVAHEQQPDPAPGEDRAGSRPAARDERGGPGLSASTR